MADLITITPPGALDTAAKSFAGAKAYFYEAGTTTAKTVYSDAALTIPHASPLVADASGLWPEIFSSGTAVKAVVTYSDDTTGYTLDPAPRSISTGSTAGEITFTPETNFPYDNVQDAIALGAYPASLVTTDAATLLQSGDFEAMRIAILEDSYSVGGITRLTSGTAATYTPSAGTRAILVRMCGGGGGGGGADGQGAGTAGMAGPGGGAGSCERFITALAASYTYTIGAGGAGGAAGANNGSDGGNTTFSGGSVSMTANGGKGGEGTLANSVDNSNYGGEGGSASGGSVNLAGRAGNYSFSSGGQNRIPGVAGASIYGGGVRGDRGSTDGVAGINFGGGGAGAGVTGVATNYSGGSGKAGIIEIWEYF